MLISLSGFSVKENETSPSDSLLILKIQIEDSTLYAEATLSRYDVELQHQQKNLGGYVEFENLTPSVYQLHIIYGSGVDGYFDGHLSFDTTILVDENNMVVTIFLGSYLSTKTIYEVVILPPDLFFNGSNAVLSAPYGYNPYTVLATSAVGIPTSNVYPVVVTSAVQPIYSYDPYFFQLQTSGGYYGSAPEPQAWCNNNFEKPWDFLLEENHEESELIIFDRNGMKGVRNSEEEIIIPPIYHSIRRMHGIPYDRYIVQKDDQFGILDGRNNWILPLEFDEIFSCAKRLSCSHSKNFLVIKKDGKYGLYTTNGDTLVAPKYDFLDSQLDEFECPAEHRLMIVSLNGQFGFINEVGEEVIPLIYDSVARFGRDWRTIVYKNGLMGVVAKDGKVIIEPAYDKIILDQYSPEIIVVLHNQKGIFNSDGKVILPVKYDEVSTSKKIYGPADHGALEDYKLTKIYFVRNNNLWGIRVYDSTASIRTEPEPKFLYDELKTMEFKSNLVQFRKGLKWGLIDQDGKVIQDAKFDEIRALDDYQYAYRIGSKWGFIYDDGKQTSPAIYDKIIRSYYYDHGLFNVKKGSLYGVCKPDGTEIIKPKFVNELHTIDLNRYGFCNFKIGSKYGLIDSTGKIICEAIYDSELPVDNFRNGNHCIFAYRLGKPVAINKNGVEIVGPYYNDFFYDSYETGNFLIVEKDAKFGVVSMTGKKLISPKYHDIENLFITYNDDGRHYFFLVGMNDKVGLVDTLGNIVLPIIYDNIFLDGHSDFRVQKDGRFGIFDYLGNSVIPATYESIRYIDDKYGIVLGANSKFGLINRAGDTLAPFKYSYMEYISSGKLFLVHDIGLEGIVDTFGNEKIKPIYQNVKFYSHDFFAVKLNGLYGFIDSSNTLVVDYKYEKVKDVWGDYVTVRLNDKFGVVTKTGEEIIPCILDSEIDYFSLMRIGGSGVQSFSSNLKYGLINDDLKIIVQPIYDNPVSFPAGQNYTVVKRNLLFGLIDTSGTEIISCIYPSLSQIYYKESHLFEVSIDGKMGMIDSANQVIIPIEYDYISSFKFYYEPSDTGCFVIGKSGKYALVRYDGKPITPFEYDRVGRDEDGNCFLYRNDKRYMIMKDGTEIRDERY